MLRRAKFPYLENHCRTDRAEIWYAVGDSLAVRFTHLKGGVHLHIRTAAPLLRISVTYWMHYAEFDVWLGNTGII